MAGLRPGVPTLPTTAATVEAAVKQARGKMIKAEALMDRILMSTATGRGYEKDLGDAADLLVEALRDLGRAGSRAVGRGSRVYPPGEFDAWTTIVVRNGSDESLTPFTYVVGDPLPGCPRLKATKRDTNLLKPKSIGRPFHPTGFSWQVAPVAPAIMQDELPEGRWADYPVPPEDVGQIAELAKAVLYLGSNFAITIDLRNVSMPFNSMPFNPAIVEALGPIETFWMRVRWHRAVRLGKHPAGGNHPAHGVVPVVFCLSGFLAASTSEKAG